LQDGTAQKLNFMRHKLMEFDAVRAIGLLLFNDYTYMGWPFPDPTKDWRGWLTCSLFRHGKEE
jgi:hypothetical protein